MKDPPPPALPGSVRREQPAFVGLMLITIRFHSPGPGASGCAPASTVTPVCGEGGGSCTCVSAPVPPAPSSSFTATRSRSHHPAATLCVDPGSGQVASLTVYSAATGVATHAELAGPALPPGCVLAVVPNVTVAVDGSSVAVTRPLRCSGAATPSTRDRHTYALHVGSPIVTCTRGQARGDRTAGAGGRCSPDVTGCCIESAAPAALPRRAPPPPIPVPPPV